MEHRDLLKDQIEKIGQTLGKLIRHLSGQAGDVNTAEILNEGLSELKGQLDIDVNFLLGADRAETKSYLLHRKVDAQKMILLADYLALASSVNQDIAQKIARTQLVKAIELMEFSEEMSGTFSIDNMLRISEYLNRLEAMPN